MTIPDLTETRDAYLPVLIAHHEEVRFCPACGFGEREPVAGIDRYGLPVPSVMCTRCGLVYLWMRPDAEGVKLLYGEREGHDRSWYRELVAAWYQQEFPSKHYLRLADEYGKAVGSYLARHLKYHKAIRILDVGGGIGRVAIIVAAALHPLNEITVLDPSTDVKAARRRGCNVIMQAVDEWEPNGDAYDLILMCQTIDHLRKPASVLRKLRDCLAPGGRLFVDHVRLLQVAAERGLIGALQVDHPVTFTWLGFYAVLFNAGFEELGDVWKHGHEEGVLLRPTPLPSPLYPGQPEVEKQRMNLCNGEGVKPTVVALMPEEWGNFYAHADDCRKD